MTQAPERPKTPHQDAVPRVAQCSPAVHAFYGDGESARAVARAKSRDGVFYTAQECPACSGWRLRRLS
jgi:hypothetical protein